MPPDDSVQQGNPLALLGRDRRRARELEDGWAGLCSLGTVTAAGDANQRTLVLRELDTRLALFFSALSPKWQELKTRPVCSVVLYLPSIQVQYRLTARWSKIADDLVHSSWQLRPDIPKKLDWLYQQHAQSTPIDREQLLAGLADDVPTPDSAPATAMGVYLDPERIERLELSSGVHQRDCWTLKPGENWQHESLVP